MAVKTIEEKMESVSSLVAGIQSRYEEKTASYDKRIADSDTAIQKMSEDFASLSESIQTQKQEMKSLEEQNRELALALARGAGSEKGEEAEMSDEVKDMYAQAIREVKGTYALNRNVMSEIVSAHVSQKFGHMSASKQDVLVKSILAEGSSPAGGMWCPVPVDSRIRKRVWETSPMRQLASVMNVNTTAMTFALDDEDMVLQARGEVDAVENTDTPQFGEVRIDVHEISAKPKATLQVLEDSTLNLEAWLAGKVANRIARQQNSAFINGDGIKKARGILNYADAGINTYKRNALGTAETAGALTIAGDDLIDLQSNLLEDFQSGAVWLMHRLIWAQVVKLKDLSGQYLLNPAVLFNGAVPQLLGAPVRLAGDMPSPVAGSLVAGTNYICYGDFQEGYTILDRLGINVIMDNITESGFVNWYFRTRYGGGVTNFQAIKRLKARA
jgi:HK97 family phage major capsid protein